MSDRDDPDPDAPSRGSAEGGTRAPPDGEPGGAKRPEGGRARADEARQRRAKLKLFLGYAPGVGKTFSMLEDARELLASGTEVVVGVVETHGQYDTASLVLGLPLLPRRKVQVGGRAVEELDLDAALARRPSVILVDDLAHANAPGGRHEKRWQEVLDLLDAGVDVHTTLNVQHVESLNDVVAQITTLREPDTVPDALLDRADEIELVDVPPEELLRRLGAGKVHLPERAARAMDHYFRRGNLLALRELALRRAADRVDADVRAYREEHGIEAPWPASERILVCVSPSPDAARLVRAARRMAAGLHAPWIAAYVEPARGPEGAGARERVDAHLRLAESLGAEVVRLTGARPGEALLDHARRHNVTRVVLGKPTHARILDRLRSSVLDDVVRGSGDIDVHVISGDGRPPEEPSRGRAGVGAARAGLAWAAALVAGVTGALHLARDQVEPPEAAMAYLLAVVLVAARLGRGPSIAAAALSAAAYDFLFVPPVFAFVPSDPRRLVTPAVMLAAGVLLGLLTHGIQNREHRAREREQRAAALHGLSRDLGAATDATGLSTVLARHVADLLGCGAAVLLPDDAGELYVASAAGAVPKALERAECAAWVMEHGRPAGAGTGTLQGAPVVCFPLGSVPAVLGVLVIAPPEGRRLATEERHTALALARQAAIALSRARLVEEVKASAVRATAEGRATAEEEAGALLGAVSHDLRAPLATIAGAARALRDPGAQLSEQQRADLLDSVCGETDRLERLVHNLLEMSRIESGGIELKREWLPIGQVLRAALARLDGKLSGRSVTVEVPPDLPLVSVDPLLMEQVFVNLLDNADKHTPPGAQVEIRAQEGDDDVTVEVLDRGPGLAAGTESRVFEKLFRGPPPAPPEGEELAAGGAASPESARDAFGAGLGLAICKGVVEAHGGSIVAENREGGGAVFRLRLPFSGPPPLVPSSAPPGVSPGDDAGTELG